MINKKSNQPGKRKPAKGKKVYLSSDLIRLNKYISNSGYCSRREADALITSGAVKVNGKIVTELGTKVKRGDKVQVEDETMKMEKMHYVLLNKPKDFISTMKDPYDRNTVMSLVRNACKERIYPVGRLDKNTTGLLLFTNDGELTKKLTHPSYEVKKIYRVLLDKELKKDDFEKIINGFELEDGFIKADYLSFTDSGHNKKEVGIELHSGRNRIVRRIFEALGYKVRKLDRTVFAGLTKKDLPRGKWRFLTEKEINFLKRIK